MVSLDIIQNTKENSLYDKEVNLIMGVVKMVSSFIPHLHVMINLKYI